MSISTNVVSVIFGNSRRACGDRILHQRDRGQILTFPDLTDQLPSTFQVWFANHPEIGTAVPQTGSGGNVAIPDTLVATGQPIWAWLYLHTGADDGETCYTVTILNTAQPAFTGATPTPAQASAWDEAIDAMNDAIEAAEAAANHGPQIVDGFWYTWDAAAGEYVNTNVKAEGEDGADGNSIWWTVSLINDESMAGQVFGKIRSSWLKGRSGTPAVHDLVVGPAVGTSGSIEWLYEIISVAGIYCNLKGIGSIKGIPGDPGADGYSPVVTITEIEGGHRVTITDEAHPQGQSFDVMDGTGGSGSSDYDDLTNKPQIAGVTLSGNKSLADLGIAAASDIPTVPVQSVNGKTGAVVLNASDVGAGTYSKPSGGIPASDLASAVQTSLGKADTALQTAPVTSVNGQIGAVTVPEPFFVTYSTSDMTTWTCDKTFAQITAAIAVGKQVVMLLSVVGTPIVQASSFLNFPTGIQVWVRLGSNTRYQISHSDDNTVSVDEFTENAAWIEAVADNQGVSHAGEFLVVGSNGYVTTMSLSTWSAGSY